MQRGSQDGSADSVIMPPLIEDNLEEIGRVCRLYGVRKLEVFGSILRRDFDPERSDVDVIVEFEPRVANSFANFLSLKEALEVLLGRPVDLIELHAVRNRRLRYYIEQSKSPVYAAA
ncbi:MAG: nucleotidyltransferase family protein [Steroidobacteraceae bacterium]